MSSLFRGIYDRLSQNWGHPYVQIQSLHYCWSEFEGSWPYLQFDFSRRGTGPRTLLEECAQTDARDVADNSTYVSKSVVTSSMIYLSPTSVPSPNPPHLEGRETSLAEQVRVRHNSATTTRYKRKPCQRFLKLDWVNWVSPTHLGDESDVRFN